MSRGGRTVGIAASVVVIDLSSKYLAYQVVKSAPMVRLSRNPDMALGSVSLSSGLVAPLVVSLVAVLLFGHALYLCRRDRLPAWSIACLGGGAVANGLDRLASGAVHDWLALATVSANVADLAILLGLFAYVRSAWNPA